MRVPPSNPGQGQGSALLGRRRPTMERPGWRSALICVGILILTMIAVAFMFVVVSEAHMQLCVDYCVSPGRSRPPQCLCTRVCQSLPHWQAPHLPVPHAFLPLLPKP
jgi:hypothetical protein